MTAISSGNAVTKRESRGRRSVTTFASMTFSMAKLIGQCSTSTHSSSRSNGPTLAQHPGSQSPFQWPHYVYENAARLCTSPNTYALHHLTTLPSTATSPHWPLHPLALARHPTKSTRHPLPYQPTLQTPDPSITLPTELVIWIPCPLLPHRRPRA